MKHQSTIAKMQCHRGAVGLIVCPSMQNFRSCTLTLESVAVSSYVAYVEYQLQWLAMNQA